MKKWIAALMFGLLGVSSIVLGDGTMAFAEKEVKFGILTALTGPAAPWGIVNSRAMMMGADEINEAGGFKVKGETCKWRAVTFDHKYVPAEAVKALNKAIFSDKVSFVSVLGGSPLVACLPLLKSNNILSLNDASGGKAVTNPGNPLVFRFNPSIEGAYASVLPYIQKRDGIKTMVSINPDDDTGRDGFASTKYVAQFFNINVIAGEFFERGTKDFAAVLTRVIAKNPDLIETGQTDPTSQALILKQARELGYKGKILLHWGPDPEQVLKIAGPLAEGAYLGTMVPEPQNAIQKAIHERFLRKGYPANEWKASYYTHYTLFISLTKAIEECSSFDPVKIANALQDIIWEGPFGPAKFGGMKIYGIKRQFLMPWNLLQIKDGKMAWLVSAPVPPGILD